MNFQKLLLIIIYSRTIDIQAGSLKQRGINKAGIREFTMDCEPGLIR